MKSKEKLARKLLILIFSISLILILGSFIYFYISGKSFIHHSAVSEIDLYENHFLKSSKTQLKEYNGKIDAFLIAAGFIEVSDEKKQTILKEYLRNNYNTIDEISLWNHSTNIAYSFKPVVVFGGEVIIEINEKPSEDFLITSESINTKIEFYKNSFFGYVSKGAVSYGYLKKTFQELTVLIHINKLALFKDITKNLYYPASINFSLVNKDHILELSTNEAWMNQIFEKFSSFDFSANKYGEDKTGQMVLSKSRNYILDSELLISKDISNIQADFKGIVTNLFLYSLFILIIILIFTIIYTNKISHSLTEISRVTNSVSKGDFSQQIKIKRNDELGLLIDSFNDMVNNIKESYDKLEVTNKELENKINELIKTKTELTKKQKLALIGETISKISHEIQNKISGVSVWVQNLETQIELENTAHMYLKEIKSSLLSFTYMLNDFKKFYRKPCLDYSTQNMESLINKLIGLYQKDICSKNIKMVKNLDPDIKEIQVDAQLMEEVLINILVNAIYYTSHNGEIKIETSFEDNQYIIIISDSGDGISAEDIEHIFNPFFTTKSSGSGLGLAISKNIIDAHGGKITAANCNGSGAIFTIKIPLNQNENISN